MGTPAYFGYLSAVFSFLYLYLFVPLSILLESYILVAYSVNMVWQENIAAQSKFRRGVAVFLPFLLSLYAVLISEIYGISGIFDLPFYYLLAGGLLIGFAFVHWISGISDSDELFSTLSCFVASLIFFAVLTVFIITRSFEIISFVFGFLFGVCVYVIRYGFSNLERLKLPRLKLTFLRRGIKTIKDLRNRQKQSTG